MSFPQTFGPYLLVDRLGQGGMGAVYLATRQGLSGIQQLCVVKTLRPDRKAYADYVSRFEDEARVVVQLGHRNIARVFDVGIIDDTYYMGMELVRGVDLSRVLERSRATGGLGGPLAVYVVTEVLEALDYAHRFKDPLTQASLEIVHRDISPHNVLLSFEGEVRLIDFGLSASTLKKTFTGPNVVMGKAFYMSPEQARDDLVDGRTDTFACAIMLYELLVGRRFYEGMTASEQWEIVGRGGHLPGGMASLPPSVQRVLQRALAPRREGRPSSAAELRSDLLEASRALGWFAGAPELRARIESLCGAEVERDQHRVQAAIALLEAPPSAALAADRPTEKTEVITLASILGDASTSERLRSPSVIALPTDEPTDRSRVAAGSSLSDPHTVEESTQEGRSTSEEDVELTESRPTAAARRSHVDDATVIVRPASASARASPGAASRAVVAPAPRRGKGRALAVAAAALVLAAGVLAAVLIGPDPPSSTIPEVAATTAGPPVPVEAPPTPVDDGTEEAGEPEGEIKDVQKEEIEEEIEEEGKDDQDDPAQEPSYVDEASPSPEGGRARRGRPPRPPRTGPKATSPLAEPAKREPKKNPSPPATDRLGDNLRYLKQACQERPPPCRRAILEEKPPDPSAEPMAKLFEHTARVRACALRCPH